MTWPFRRNSNLLALQLYWDSLVRNTSHSEQVGAAALLDPTTVDLIAGIRSLRPSDQPDPAFLDQLETQIMSTFVTTPATPIPIRPAATRSPQATTQPAPWSQILQRRQTIAAGLAVLLVIAIAVYNVWPSDNQPVIVAPQTTEAPVATPDAITPVPVSMYRGDATRSSNMPGPAPSGIPGALWRVQANDQIQSAVTVANGIAYVGSNDGTLYALDTQTGAEKWTLTTANDGLSPMTIIDGSTVYTVGGDGLARALDAQTGNEIWHSSTDQVLVNQIIQDGDLLLIGGQDAAYYAVNTDDGSIAWRSEIGAAPVSLGTVVVDGTLYFGANDGLLYALDVATGNVSWTFATGYEAVKSLAYNEGTLFATTGTDSISTSALVGVDVATQSELWRYSLDTGSVSAPAIFGDSILMGTPNGTLFSLAADSGSINWTFDTGLTQPISAAPAIVGTTAYAVSDDGNLYALDATTGEQVWRVALDGPMNMTPAITGGVIYLGTWSGGIYALSDAGIPLATPVKEIATPIATPVSDVSEASPAVLTNPVTLDWQTDARPGGNQFQVGLSMAPDGSYWLADSIKNQFLIFNARGTFAEAWGEPGADDSQFALARGNGDGYGMAIFNANGSFYVLDPGNFRVQAFDKDRTFLTAWGSIGTGDSQFQDPIGICLDPDGNVLVLDGVRGDVQKFSPDGTLIETIVLKGETYGYNSLNGITIDAAGNIYTSGSSDGVRPYNQVVKYDPEGNILTIFRADSGPGHLGDQVISVAVDAAGNVYAALWAYDPRIVVFAADGSFLAQIDVTSESDLTSSYGIILDGSGRLIVSDGTQLMVARFDLQSPLWPLEVEATPAS